MFLLNHKQKLQTEQSQCFINPVTASMGLYGRLRLGDKKRMHPLASVRHWFWDWDWVLGPGFRGPGVSSDSLGGSDPCEGTFAHNRSGVRAYRNWAP